MTTLDALNWRYACKAFDSTKKVSAEQIDRLKEGLNLTASSYGLQPLKFLFIENKEKREALVEHSWNQRQVAEASHLIVIAVRTDIDENFIGNYIQSMSEKRGIPLEHLNDFKGMMMNSVGSMPAEQQFLWAKSQAYITLGTLLLQCGMEKIDATPMEGFIPAKYDEILGLDKMNLKSVLVCPVGYRSEEDAYANLPKVRQNTNDICVELN